MKLEEAEVLLTGLVTSLESNETLAPLRQKPCTHC